MTRLLEAERRLALAAAAPAGYVPVHGHGRGGYLLIGELAVAPKALHAVLKEKGLGNDALYLPICEIASTGFVQAIATLQNNKAAGSTTFAWVDPKKGTTVATSLVVDGLRVRPKPGAPDGDFPVFDPGGNGPVGSLGPVQVWPGMALPIWPEVAWVARGAGAPRLGRPPVLSPVPQQPLGLASHWISSSGIAGSRRLRLGRRWELWTRRVWGWGSASISLR